MSRPIPQHGEPVNGDSFLDIVASVVSIMIIMVVMEGMRIKNAPVKVAIPTNPATKELEQRPGHRAIAARRHCNMAEETQHVQQELAARGLQRDVLATMVSAAEQEIQERRQTAGPRQAGQLRFRPRAVGSRSSNSTNSPAAATGGQPPAAPMVIESYPTPISRTVDGPEAHLLVSNGRVVFVPIRRCWSRSSRG